MNQRAEKSVARKNRLTFEDLALVVFFWLVGVCQVVYVLCCLSNVYQMCIKSQRKRETSCTVQVHLNMTGLVI